MTRRIVHSLTQIRWQSAHVPPSRPGWGIGRVVVDDPLSEIHLASHARAGVRLPVRMIIYVAGSLTKLPRGRRLELVIDPAGNRELPACRYRGHRSLLRYRRRWQHRALPDWFCWLHPQRRKGRREIHPRLRHATTRPAAAPDTRPMRVSGQFAGTATAHCAGIKKSSCAARASTTTGSAPCLLHARSRSTILSLLILPDSRCEGCAHRAGQVTRSRAFLAR